MDQATIIKKYLGKLGVEPEAVVVYLELTRQGYSSALQRLGVLREPLLTDNAPASLWQAGRQALLLLWLWLVRRCRRFAIGRGPFLGRPAAQYRKAHDQSQYPI